MASFGFNLVLILSAVIIFFTATGYSLVCYDCSSSVGGACGNFSTFDKSASPQTQNCTLNDQVCGISTEIQAGYDTKIRRSCVSADYCAAGNASKFVTDCRVCKTNLCNSSHNVVPSFGIITFLVLCFSSLYFNIYT